MGNRIERKNVEDIFALTPLQQGMLFHYLRDTGSSEYIEQLSLRLKGTINAAAIKKAWDHVVQCNEMLRTVYRWEKLETPVQVVQREYELPVRYIEIKEKSKAEELIKEIRETDKADGKDISTEPFRVTIVKFGENEGEMIITNHHILYDGWSSGIIVKEFAEAYESILDGKEPVKRVKPRFKEYVKWQQKQNKEEQLRYWKDYLEGCEEKAIIAGYRSGEVKNEETAVYHEALEPELKSAIENVCREEKVAMATVINAAWGILLQRYNNTGDAVFGTTVSGRAVKLEGIEEAVGLYINTLPIRVKAEGKESISEVLKQVERDTREREAYESLSLAEIQGAVEAGSGESLFDTLVVIENYPIDKRLINKEGKIELQICEVKEATNYDITVEVMIRDIIGLSISYKTGKYEIEGIKRLAGHLKNILWEVSRNSRKPVEEIEMISEKEKQQLSYEFNDTYAEYPGDKTIHELFEDQAARTPDNRAVVYEDRQLTYKELNEKSNQLARVLREKGVARDSIVGIMVERSLEMIVGIIAILKAGGAYLPIDPEYPSERIKFMLEDCKVGIWLTHKSLGENIEYEAERIRLDEGVACDRDGHNLKNCGSHNDLAYIMYTSGSTGKPKGVMIENKSVVRLVKDNDYVAIKQSDRILQTGAIVFDATTFEIWGALLNGASLYLVDKEKILNAEKIEEEIRNNKITTLWLTSPLYNQIVEQRPEALAKCGNLLVGGDVLSPKHINKVRRLNKEIRIINGYGPTENTTFSTCYTIEKEYDNSIPIGKPIKNSTAYILGKNMKLQPIGVPGEIYVGGDGLARGYINRRSLTAEKFVENPFEPEKRLYKTGDSGRWLPDGNIEFLGRIDQQVKIRGFRIELGEIEKQLLKHEAVKEAVVVAKDNESSSKYLCAYITIAGDEQVTITELREHLKRELPDYMIPSYFVQLDKIPLTQNGKIDRKALPELCGDIETGTAYEAPRNEMEEKLVGIWQEVLGADRVGISDDFFELGGHSLKATSLVAKIHKELNVKVALREIFRIPTIKELADYIKGQEESIYKTVEPVEEREWYELSSAQKRLYTLQQLDLESTGYNMPGALEIEGKLDVDRLENVFRELIKRHEALRTSFELIGEEIVQKVYKKVEFEIEYMDNLLFTKDNELSAEAVKETIRSFIRPFNLNRAPLLRVGLIKLRPEKHILMFDMHHIISDGISIGILTDEFVKLYEGQELPPLRLQYKDYAIWQNSVLCSEVMKTQEEYWLKAFEGEIPVLSLPEDYQRPAIQSFEGDSLCFELEKEITSGLRRAAKETGATMYMVLLAGFNILLSKYSGQEDIVIGSPIAGRPHADLKNIMGMFVNTLAMRNYPEGSKTIIEFIKEVKRNALKAYENQDYQFEELIEKLNIKRDMSRNPVFDVMFAMQNMDIEEIAIEGMSIKPYTLENRVSKFDITLTAVEAEEKIRLNIEYCSRLFSKETMERMAGHLKNVLKEIEHNANKRISEIELLDEGERHKLLYEFNDTFAEYPRDKTIQELFEEQAARTPDNTAVAYEDRQLTYRELNERANQLARVLREKGVVPDSVVGIMAERSLEMIVGIMGILKAGGAYLPIDPEYPQERIGYMLEDSKANIVLMQSSQREKMPFNEEILLLDDENLYNSDTGNIENINKPEDIVYVIYTSGSTGRPKGVAVKHTGVVNYIVWAIKNYQKNEKLSLPLYTSISFDLTVTSIYMPLLSGNKVVIYREYNKQLLIEEIIDKNEIDMIKLTPAHLKLIKDKDNRKSKIKRIIVGGEQLETRLAVDIYKSFDCNVEIYNEYGPTEASVGCMIYKFDVEKDKRTVVPIGIPADNTKIYIVDKYGKLVPCNVAGELCISGDGLARGYLNRRSLTAEKFVENPFEPGTRMYKTGDLARWLPDGNIEFLGRIDHQVKIRGFRIELGEIENQLLKHEAVKEAVVVAKDNESGSKYLCAYITIAGDEQVTITELREHLKRELPDYMIPSYFVQLDKIPLTQNGKIDRKALPEPDVSMVSGAEYEAARNEVEEKLVKIWREVLKVDRVGINDNFFELGGHSLRATSMVAKIHKELNTEVPLREIFKTPTIKGLSEYIKGQEENIYAEIQPVEEREYYGLSSAQKRLYTLQLFEEESSAYNIPGALMVEGKLDAKRLEEAFRKLIERHESLRTSFQPLGEEIVQRVRKEVEFQIEYREASEDEVEEIVGRFVKAFDLSKAPLLRVGLIKVLPEKHILMYDMHHIISDGTSMGILVDEIVKLYEGKELGELRIQYKDFSSWQNELFKTERIKEQEEYWTKEFGGEIPVLNLATDYPRPVIQSFEGDRIYFVLDEEITAGLRRLAKETGTTMYMILLASFNILLSKYSGQEDIVVGSPIAGRPHGDLENIIGMFVNTLAIRNYPEGRKTFRAFLEEVKAKCLKVYENQDYQFEELVEKLDVARDMSRNPLFDVMLVLQNTEMGVIDIEGLRFSEYENKNRVSKFDMLINAAEGKDGVGLEIEYCTKLFNRKTIEALGTHFINIIKNAIDNTEVQLQEIEILSEVEKNKLIYEFNDTDAEYPKDKTIQQLFEEQAERTPDNVAVVYEDKQLTYKELNEKANQLARKLREKGVAADGIVGVMIERSLEMIVGIMGVLKAGGAYLPIDPEYPKDRIGYMLEDSGAGMLLTQKHLRNNVDFRGEAIELDDEKSYEEERGNLNVVSKPEDLAYLIYTSGSTGRPKGVGISHRALNNFIASICYYYENKIAEKDRCLSSTNISFDVSVGEIFLPLTKGAMLVLFERNRIFDIGKFAETIKDKEITFAYIPPTVLTEVNDRLKEEKVMLNKTLVGVEPIKAHVLKAYLELNEEMQIVNGYGPTEATICATMYKFRGEEPAEKNVPIGKPLLNTRIYIVNSSNKLQPIGVAGELCIAGDGLARGYLNRPEMTAEKFVDNLFISGERMYRTGDMARWLPDGNIEFLGRIDNQIKIRGFRIELGEIESQLLKHGAVKEAVVIARESASGDKYLCAYITANGELKVADLRKHLSRELPNYMIPSYYVQLDSIPLTSNGKIDRKALPEPDGSIATGMAYEAPGDETEEELCKIWQEVLKVERVGINDNFFELGGHSLKAISLAAKIQKELGVEVALREIFRIPTIKELAAYIKGQEESIYKTVEPVEEKKWYELSSAQKRLYTLQQLDLESTGYNMPGVLEMKGKLEAERLENAFRKLIKRHETLRTSFELMGGEIVQKVHEEVDFEIEYMDNSLFAKDDELSTDARDKTIRSFIRPFDLSRAPLLRVGLVKLHPEEYILMFDMHHIISDGASMGILVEEFVKLYEGKELSPLKIQYKDYAAWQNSMLHSAGMKRQEKYWLKEYEGEISVLSLPTDYPRAAIQSFEGDSIRFELGEGITRGLRKIAKETGATMYMVLLAGFNILLSKYSGQEDIVIGSPIVGRSHADLENVMGMFVNTLAMRNYPEGSKTIREFIEEVRISALRAYENQNYQFEELVEKLNIRRDMSRNPVFDVMFAMQNLDIEEIAIEGISIKSYGIENRISKFDLTLTALEAEEKIGLSIEYCSRLFSKETVERMAGHLKNLLKEIGDNANKRISEVELLDEEERYKLLYEFNDTRTAYPRDKTIQELFEEQVARTPDNVALVYKDKQLTYRELNKKANQLARVLRNKGVKRDNIVGMMVERSLEMIVGIIGILKAGGSYLPIDPEYPGSRIEYKLEDSGAGILLIQDSLRDNIAFKGEVIELDNERIYEEETGNLEILNDPEDLAYVIYTSGSTGKPKGVMLHHRGIINNIFTKMKEFKITESDVLCHSMSVSFAASIWQMLLPLMIGAKVRIYPQHVISDAGKLFSSIIKDKVNIVEVVPTLINAFLDSCEMMPELNELKTIVLTGEQVKTELARKFYEKYITALVNAYGQTECTDDILHYHIPNFIKTESVLIGKPSNNTSIYIIDKYNNLQPIGVAGEICAAGDLLTRGYLNRQGLTAEKFVYNPFGSGTKMYRTGDLGRWLPDGNIEFIGRIDHQVKIRGFRIELGEIEAQLMKHGAVKEAVVVARESLSEDRYLCAYIVAAGELEVTDLREHLSRELPDYMIPSYFVRLDKMPLTPNGKIDRKALPEAAGSMETGTEYEAPTNDMEERLVSIWQEVLGIEKIGIKDNFFALGGHSLKALRIVNLIKQQLHTDTSLQDIFQYDNIASLCKHIRFCNIERVIEIDKAPEQEYYGLSYNQNRLLILNQLNPGGTEYNIYGYLEINESVDVVNIRKALEFLIDRHESLRTSIIEVEGCFMQKIEERIDFEVAVIDISIFDENKKKTELERLHNENNTHIFDLGEAPLISSTLVKLSENEYELLFCMHHIISDGWSMNVLRREFAVVYQAYRNNQEPYLEPLYLQYKDFAEWQNRQIEDSTQTARAKEYWKNQLKENIFELNMSMKNHKNQSKDKMGSSYRTVIGKEVQDRLKEIAANQKSSLFSMMLSAFYIYFAELTQSEDITFGIAGSGRDYPGLENVFGYFVNTVFLRNKVNMDNQYLDLLNSVNSNVLNALQYQDYPIELILDELKIKYPPINVFINMLNMFEHHGVSLEDKQSHHSEDIGHVKFDMEFYLTEYADGIEIVCTYIKQYFDPKVVEYMLNEYSDLLLMISEDAGKKAAEYFD